MATSPGTTNRVVTACWLPLAEPDGDDGIDGIGRIDKGEALLSYSYVG
jgi:hypothetical protein